MSRSLETIHSFGRQHDHQHCIDEALATAAKICHENGAKLTWIRRRVLELIWSAHEPVLAYDLLKSIRVDKPNAAPPTVYRALEFLSNQKLIHTANGSSSASVVIKSRRRWSGGSRSHWVKKVFVRSRLIVMKIEFSERLQNP